MFDGFNGTFVSGGETVCFSTSCNLLARPAGLGLTGPSGCLHLEGWSLEVSIRVTLMGVFCSCTLTKAPIKNGRRHVQQQIYDDIQSRNVAISFRSRWHKWVIPRMSLAHHGKPMDHLTNSFLQKVISQQLNLREEEAELNVWGHWADGGISMKMALIDHVSDHRVMAAEWYLSSTISAPSNKYIVHIICIGIGVLMDMGLPLNLGVIPRHRFNHSRHFLSHNGLTSL